MPNGVLGVSPDRPFKNVRLERFCLRLRTLQEPQTLVSHNSTISGISIEGWCLFLYMFDGGHRLSGEAIMAQIRIPRDSGKCLQSNVNQPDIHISGNTAWIAYIREGSITDDSGRMNQEWVESAVLEKQEGNWKIDSVHSTRVPRPPETRE
jgi:hypothetical protein